VRRFQLALPCRCCAVEEVPEEGLDVPLRLEKMANEVTYRRLKAALTVRGLGLAWAAGPGRGRVVRRPGSGRGGPG
jgi:hypothetical protein